jgi:DNA replication licensing factor MCM6
MHLRRKEFYLGITGLKYKHQIRHLTSDKIGKLVRISGQVVRTHPVHPELSIGSFVCDDCGLAANNIVQHFKYTQVNHKIYPPISFRIENISII